MATILLFLFLTFAVSMFVVYPIVQTRGRWQTDSSNHTDTELLDHKETIYAAIKDIEFDYQMGKLSEADFQELRQQYKDDAIKLLKKIDKRQKRAVRANIRAKKSKEKSPNSGHFCWLCGMALVASDKFCANCGNKIE